MSEQRPTDVLGALPRRRPHRRSEKRRALTPDGGPVASNGIEPSTPQAAQARERTPATRENTRAATPRKSPATGRKPPAKRKPTSATPPATPPPATPRPTTERATTRRPQRLRQPAQPAGVPATPRRRPAQPGGRHILGTAAQAAAELAEIGLAVGARALRGMVDRLPRP